MGSSSQAATVPLGSAIEASRSSIAVPATLVGILLIIGMVGLALFINPGGAPQVADGRTFWYTGFADSDRRLLAASSQWTGKAHRLALTIWRRGAATAAWLVGR